MAKTRRKKTAIRAKKAGCGKIHHKKAKRSTKSKKSFLDKILSF